MAIGFVLIITSSLHKEKVRDNLTKVFGVVEVTPLSGEYDLIVKVDVDDFDSLTKVMTDEIGSIEGILGTKTLVATIFF